MGDFYVLDFDGVFCDSCGESFFFVVKVKFFDIFYVFVLFDFEVWNFSLFLRFGLLNICVLQQVVRVRWFGLFVGVDLVLEEWIVDQMYIVNLLFLLLFVQFKVFDFERMFKVYIGVGVFCR